MEQKDDFPGMASLLQQVDKKLIVVLRDGRKLIGYLRSFDQFGNLVLHETIERVYAGNVYGDMPRGIFLIRGESIVMMGEISPAKEATLPLQQVSFEEALFAQADEREQKEEEQRAKSRALVNRGLQPGNDPTSEDVWT
eukprot:Clim_evm47s88 gene=Clim_evmTU47s88